MSESYYRNLVKGQYQLGDIVMGNGTNITVENFDVKPYDLNQQDYQVSRSDEMRFGYDSLKPTSIEMTMNVMYNWLLDPFKNTRTNFWHNMPTVSDLEVEWRSYDVRNKWNEMKPLYFCGRDGIGKVIYGRPGQFGAEKTNHRSTHVKCVGEFRRADTLAYSITENSVQLSSNATPQFIWRGVGDASSWLRIVGYGPITNPVITVGSNQISLNISIAANEAFEISSYPWQRRIVKSDATNIRNTLNASSPYLDKMQIPVKQFVPVRWTSQEVNMWVPWLGNADWNIDLTDANYWKKPTGFTDLWNEVIVKKDLVNPSGLSPYITGKVGVGTTATIYNAQKFKTTTQYMQARIVEPFWGRSGLVIMSNSNMTNYALLEVSSGPGNNKLIIRNTYDGVARATYTHSASGGWSETDIVGIGYEPVSKKFSAYLNGTEVAYWVDSTNLVTANALTNCYSGFMFNIGATALSLGTGFKDIVAYDKVFVPAQTGSMYLYWRDAWTSIE